MRIDVRRLTGALMLAGALAATPARALDHDNLDVGRPLRIDDAYPIAKGEIAVDVGVTAHDRRGDGFGYGTGVRVLAGPWYNAQVEIGGDLAFEGTSAAATDRAGAVTLGLLFNLNTESLDRPAIALRADAEAPSGARDAGVDVSGGLVVTRTFGRLRTHLNADYTLAGSAPASERRGRYDAAVGASYPLGYPTRFRETLIADVFTRQSPDGGEANATGLELGVRHQLSARVVLDAGAGSEVFGPDERAAWFGIVGLSVGF
jgi:hypothetical protein